MNTTLTTLVPSPEEVLVKQAKEAGVHKELYTIFNEWRLIKPMCLQAAETMLDYIPGENSKTLLSDMLQKAVQGWSTTDSADDADRYLAFLKGLLELTPTVKDWCVFVQPKRGEDIVWDPLGVSLSKWINEQEKIPSVVYREEYDPRPPVSDEEYRTIFGGRFIQTHDLYVINHRFSQVFGGTP